MNKNAMLTGKPSIDRPWMKFYPDVLRGIQVPACTVEQYLSVRAADPNVTMAWISPGLPCSVR